MEDEKKIIEPERPKDRRGIDWNPPHCPWVVFANDDSAEYDIEKMKKFFGRKFKKKKKHND